MDDVSGLQRQRLLEGWLPLAQEINQRYHWRLEAGALEALILSAAPRLSDVANAERARMIFCWLYHKQHITGMSSVPDSRRGRVIKECIMAEVPHSADQHAALIETLSDELTRRYVFPDTGIALAALLKERHAAGVYMTLDGPELCAALTSELQERSGDRHLRIFWSDIPLPPAAPDGAEAEGRARYAETARLRNYGFTRVERLAGNVGYLDLRSFDAPTIGGPTAVAAMTLLAPTEALIVDLRQNGGGWPQMVALLCSYLFEPDERPVHLNSLYWREEDITQQFWTLPYVPGPRFGGTKPVYVLTSARTFSGAEEFCYNLQSLGRATLIGETTRGGANPGSTYRITDHCAAFIPTGRAINPRRGDNWEGRGVTPDIQIPAEEALTAAWRLALEHVCSTLADATPGPRADLALEARQALAALQP